MNISQVILYSIFIGLISISILFLILTSTVMKIDEEKAETMDYVYNNWKKGAILDITLSQEFCPSGYVPSELYETEEIIGNSITNDTGETYNIPSRKKQMHFTYRGSLICIIRQRQNYIASDNYVASCSTKCGTGDMLGNLECDAVDSCSVSSVLIINKNDPTPPGYFRQEFFDGKKSLIFSKRNSSSSPTNTLEDITVIGFKLSLGEICANPLERGLDKSYGFELFKNYENFNNCKTSISGYRINPHYSWIDRDYGANVFLNSKKNRIYTEDQRDISNDSSIYNFQKVNYEFPNYNLYIEHYAGLNPRCNDFSEFKVFQSYVSKFKTGELGKYSSVPIILFSITLVLGFAGLIVKIGCWNEKWFIAFGLLFILYFLICLIVIWIFYAASEKVFFTYGLHNNFPINNFSFKLEIESCFDSFSAGIIEYVGYMYSGYHAIYLFSAIILTIIFTFISIFPFIVCFLDGCYSVNFSFDD